MIILKLKFTFLIKTVVVLNVHGKLTRERVAIF